MKTAFKATILFVSFLLISSILLIDDSSDADNIVVQDIGSGVTLTWNKTTGVAEITATSDWARTYDFSDGSSPLYRQNLTSITVSEGIIYLGNYLFQSTGFDSISLPNSIQQIGEGTFRSSSIKSLNLPNLESIGKDAFMGSSIASVVLSPNTTSIGERAFSGSNLASIDLKSVRTLGEQAFSLTSIRTLDIPSTVEVIPASLCWRATQLYSVTLHEGLKKIDDFAFQQSGLTSISFPSTLTYIGTGAFMSTKISGVIAYPHSLTHLDGIVFGDTNVTGYKFPAGITEGTVIGGFGNVHFYKDGVELTNVDLYNGALWGRIWSGTTTSMTYQGEYVPTFTVSFSANGGSLSPPTSFSASPGDSFSVPSYTGTKTGYTFDYWSCSDGTIAYPGSTKIMPFSDLLLTAHWSGAKHTVYYDVNGGSSTVPSITVSEGEVFSLPSYSGTKSGYSFVGWTLGSTTYNVGYRITMGSSDLTFVASWKSVPSHTAYFDVNGGTPSVPSLTVYEGSNASIPSVSPTKTGYDFDGWTCNGKKYYPSNVFTMGTSDMYFVADWVEHVVTTYTVSYDTKGGSDSVPSQHVQSGSKFSVAYYYGSKTGYTFDGWSYDSSIYYPGSLMTMGNSDITFKAVWKETPQPTPSPGSDVIVIFGFELTYMTLTLIGIIAIMGIALVILLIKRR